MKLQKNFKMVYPETANDWFNRVLEGRVLTDRINLRGFHFWHRKLIVTGSFIPSDKLDTLKAQNDIPKETWACLVYITNVNHEYIGQFIVQTCEEMFSHLFKIMIARRTIKC